MEIIKRVTSWVRTNVAVLGLLVAVLGLGGGFLVAFYNVIQRLDALATEEHVTNTVNVATESLNNTVERLDRRVESLDGTVGELRETVGELRGEFTGLQRVVDKFETSVTRSSTTLADSADKFNEMLPLVSCAIYLGLGTGSGGGMDSIGDGDVNGIDFNNSNSRRNNSLEGELRSIRSRCLTELRQYLPDP